jgi:hypothetical protein
MFVASCDRLKFRQSHIEYVKVPAPKRQRHDMQQPVDSRGPQYVRYSNIFFDEHVRSQGLTVVQKVLRVLHFTESVESSVVFAFGDANDAETFDVVVEEKSQRFVQVELLQSDQKEGTFDHWSEHDPETVGEDDAVFFDILESHFVVLVGDVFDALAEVRISVDQNGVHDGHRPVRQVVDLDHAQRHHQIPQSLLLPRLLREPLVQRTDRPEEREQVVGEVDVPVVPKRVLCLVHPPGPRDRVHIQPRQLLVERFTHHLPFPPFGNPVLLRPVADDHLLGGLRDRHDLEAVEVVAFAATNQTRPDPPDKLSEVCELGPRSLAGRVVRVEEVVHVVLDAESVGTIGELQNEVFVLLGQHGFDTWSKECSPRPSTRPVLSTHLF